MSTMNESRASPVLDPNEEKTDHTKESWHVAHRKHVRSRYAGVHEAIVDGRYRRGVASTRFLVVAQALAVFMLGFLLDDLAVLRVPGFLVGVVGAVVVLGLGGLPQGAWVARRTRGLKREDEDGYLFWVRAVGGLLLLVMAVVAVLFLIVIGAGVPPWA